MARRKSSRRKLSKEVGWGQFKAKMSAKKPKKVPYKRKGKFALYDPVRDAMRKNKAKNLKNIATVKFSGGKLILEGQPYAVDRKKVYIIVQGKKRKKPIPALFRTKKEAREFLKTLQKAHPRAHYSIRQGWI